MVPYFHVYVSVRGVKRGGGPGTPCCWVGVTGHRHLEMIVSLMNSCYSRPHAAGAGRTRVFMAGGQSYAPHGVTSCVAGAQGQKFGLEAELVMSWEYEGLG